jgi:leucine dehydrogenase
VSPSDPFELCARLGLDRLYLVTDPASGLRALIAIDDTTLGPAAGGVRTRRYATFSEALVDAAALARAMTEKCALAGLAAGGGKAVVQDHDGLDRPRAFAALGARVEELGGLFRTAGDLGTTAGDLAAMATTTRFVHTDEAGLADAVGRGHRRCVETLAARRGVPLAGLRVAVQGAGAIGAAVARALSRGGAEITIADLDEARARAVAEVTGARVVAPDRILEEACDIVAPCAIGGVIDEQVASRIRAFAVCGAANNVLAGDQVAEVLRARAIWLVPDQVASAGAVIEGIGSSFMGLADRGPLIDRLGETAAALLDEAEARGISTVMAARERARARIASIAEAPGSLPPSAPSLS